MSKPEKPRLTALMRDDPASPEGWLAVAGYSGVYEVSDRGNVRHSSVAKARRAVKQTLSTDGYRLVKLGAGRARRTLRVHVLVALAFIGPRPAGMEVNHLDGDKQNNTPGNLEWATRQRNIIHAFEHGLISPQPGESNGRAKLSAGEVAEIRRQKGKTGVRNLAARFNVSRSAIQFIHQGKHWKEKPMDSTTKSRLTGLMRDDPATPEGKYLVKRRDGSTVEWPSFVLGARDPHAAVALRAYAASIRTDPDCDPRFADRLLRLADEFDEFRALHGPGDPTRGRHRKDDPATIAEMRGNRSA